MSDGIRPTVARPSPPRRRSRKKAKVATGLEPGPDGTEVGADPRRLSTDDLRALGHRGKPLLQAMRKRCVDCCGGKTDEVRQCTAIACPLWPYRMATDPWHSEPAAPRPAAKLPPVEPVAMQAPVLNGASVATVKPAAPPARAPKSAAKSVAKPVPAASAEKRSRPRAKASTTPSLPFMDIA